MNHVQNILHHNWPFIKPFRGLRRLIQPGPLLITLIDNYCNSKYILKETDYIFF